MIKVGDEVEAKFTNVDRKNRTVALSIKAKEVHEEAEALSTYNSDTAAAPAGTTLGELLKEKMSRRRQIAKKSSPDPSRSGLYIPL